jgi:hypothetical protein
VVNPFGPRIFKSFVHRNSPLSTSTVITRQESENEQSLRNTKQLNQNSIQRGQINEETLSKIIERNQLSILTGNLTRPPSNFANQNIVSQTVQANQLTMHHAPDFDIASASLEAGIVNQSSMTNSPWRYYQTYLKESTGSFVGIFIVVLFFLVQSARFLSGIF